MKLSPKKLLGLCGVYRILLPQIECLSPSKIHLLKPNPPCDGIWRGDIWGMLRLEPG